MKHVFSDECKHLMINLDQLIYARLVATPTGTMPICVSFVGIFLWYNLRSFIAFKRVHQSQLLTGAN